MAESKPGTFREFLREYVDDLVRLVTLAALCAVVGSGVKDHLGGGVWYVIPAFVGLLTVLLFLSNLFTVGNYIFERYAKPNPQSIVLFLLVLSINVAAMYSTFFVVLTVVLEAAKQATKS